MPPEISDQLRPIPPNNDGIHERMLADVERERAGADPRRDAMDAVKYQLESGFADLAIFAASTALSRGKPITLALGAGLWAGGAAKAAFMHVVDPENADFVRDASSGAIDGMVGPVAKWLGGWSVRQIEDVPLIQFGETVAKRGPGLLTGTTEGAVLGYTAGFNSTYARESYLGTSFETARDRAIASGIHAASAGMILGGIAGTAARGSMFTKFW